MKRIFRIEKTAAVSPALPQQDCAGNGRFRMEIRMKEKKRILIASISGGAVLLALLLTLAALIGSASRSAAGAARTFEALLSEGKLAELEARCYLPETGQIRFTTPAELAQRFGAEAVLAGHDASPEEELLPVIMRYSTLRVTTGMVIGNRASAVLTLTGPAFAAWLGGSGGDGAAEGKTAGPGSEEDAAESADGGDAKEQDGTEAVGSALPESVIFALLVSGDGLPEVLEACLADGAVPMRTVRLRIPMRKANGSWRFAVTQETENAWFGGLLLPDE